MLVTPWPGAARRTAGLPVPCRVAVPQRLTSGRRSAPPGWRRFLWLNQLAGFVVTLLLIWYTAVS